MNPAILRDASVFARRSRSSRRGSVLIAALIFCAIIAVSLVSFLRLSTQSAQLAYRSFYAGAAMNVAETGLEQAMWAVNKRLAGDTGVWSAHNWSVQSNGTVRRTINLGTLSGGATAQVKVLVSNANLVGANPFILARSIVTPPTGEPIERWINIKLQKRSRFSTGLVAKDMIKFSGNNASVDSYDSRRGAYTASSFANRFDRGTAGSASVEVNTFNLGNADIWGYAVIGTSDYSGLSVGNNGVVGPFGSTSVNYDHVRTDFTANFDDEAHPAAYSGTGTYNITAIKNNATLPRATDLPKIETSGGVTTATYYYNIGSITLSGSDTLNIAGNVVIRMTSSTGETISVTGNGAIAIADSTTLLPTSLNIYTQSDVKIAGNGVSHNGKPSAFMIWGTRPQSNSNVQSITVNGNGVLSGVVYAPNANISLHGGGNSGNVYGAMIGKTVTVTGNSAFHYDEALAELDSGEPFGMTEWNEFVTYADRTTYASLMTF